MSRHEDIVRLKHMRDHAREAVSMAAGLSRLDFERNRMLQLALMRLVEMIGEAAGRVTDDGRGAIALPWSEIIGMRHRLVHGYDNVNLNVLWDTVEMDLSPLIRTLDEIIGRLEREADR